MYNADIVIELQDKKRVLLVNRSAKDLEPLRSIRGGVFYSRILRDLRKAYPHYNNIMHCHNMTNAIIPFYHDTTNENRIAVYYLDQKDFKLWFENQWQVLYFSDMKSEYEKYKNLYDNSEVKI